MATFLWDRLCEEQLTQAALARDLGVDQGTVGNLLKGGAPTERTYQRLREKFGDELPIVATETERRRQMANERLPLLLAAARTPDAIRRRAQAQRGQTRPATSAAVKAFIARQKEEGKEWGNAWLGPRNQTVPVRAAMGLTRRLKLCPAPDRSTLERWAREVATRLGLPAEAVMAMWRPVLRERGLRRTGRPPKEERHDLVAPLVADALTDTGRVPRGFWPRAAAIVNEKEQRGPNDVLAGDDLKRWWVRYEKTCTSCVTAKLTPQQAVNHPSA